MTHTEQFSTLKNDPVRYLMTHPHVRFWPLEHWSTVGKPYFHVENWLTIGKPYFHVENWLTIGKPYFHVENWLTVGHVNVM